MTSVSTVSGGLWPSIWTYFYDFVTLLSLGLTIPALLVSFLVIVKWHKEHTLYMQAKRPTQGQVLIAGIYRGFIGSFVDNAWWGLAWTFAYLGIEFWRDVFFAGGVFSNVIFRQAALIVAGILHIDAENMNKKDVERVAKAKADTRRFVRLSALMGAVAVAALVLIKPLI